jgi:uncharacterized membrane protein
LSVKIATWFERMKGTYWLIPALMVTSSILLSFITVHLDRTGPPGLLARLGWIAVEDPDGGRAFLSVVAGSMISTTGITFSITIASLVSASSQLGPRVLNNFLRDRGNQLVLGTLTATYTFCLFVLKSINSTPGEVFVPNLSITISIVLTIFSLAALVYFFHHISTSLQADYVIAQIGEELTRAIEHLFPEKMRYRSLQQKLLREEDLPEYLSDEGGQKIKSSSSGYLQALDVDTLVVIAEENELLMRTELRPGEFTAEENTLLTIWPSKEIPQELKKRMEGSFILGDQRLRIQDVEYHLNQLIEIALRALSTGINDPLTAMSCVDQISAALSQLMERSIPTGYNYDSNEKLRLITKPLTFTDIIEKSFNQIRRNGADSVSVTVRLLEGIELIAPHIRTGEQKTTLIRQADILLRQSKEKIRDKYDKEIIQKQHQKTLNMLTG